MSAFLFDHIMIIFSAVSIKIYKKLHTINFASVNSLVVLGFSTSIGSERKGIKLVAKNETASKALTVEKEKLVNLPSKLVNLSLRYAATFNVLAFLH